MSNGKWLNNIARLIKKQDGTYFLKFGRQTDKNGKVVGKDQSNPFPLTINEGDIFQAKLKADDLKGLVEQQKLTQEQADNICKTVKFEFSRAPQDNKSPKKPNSDDGVNF